MRTDESARLKLERVLRLDFALRLVWQSAPEWTMASLALLVDTPPTGERGVVQMGGKVDTLIKLIRHTRAS